MKKGFKISDIKTTLYLGLEIAPTGFNTLIMVFMGVLQVRPRIKQR